MIRSSAGKFAEGGAAGHSTKTGCAGVVSVPQILYADTLDPKMAKISDDPNFPWGDCPLGHAANDSRQDCEACVELVKARDRLAVQQKLLEEQEVA